jgi:hypothetical protein
LKSNLKPPVWSKDYKEIVVIRKIIKMAIFHGMKIGGNGEIRLNIGIRWPDMFIKSGILYRKKVKKPRGFFQSLGL